jgi:hypothetical protein
MNDWPIDPPTLANPIIGIPISPMLPVDGGFPANRRDFATKAFVLFSRLLMDRIKAVNMALRMYHESGGSDSAYQAYQAAAAAYRSFIKHPVIKLGYNPKYDPLPARVFAIENLVVDTKVEGDYCVGVQISGSVVFSAGGPVGESSSSSSSYGTLPMP